MATLDRQIPSVDTFLCEPWSSFVSAAKLRFVDNAESSSGNSDKELCCPGEAVKPCKEGNASAVVVMKINRLNRNHLAEMIVYSQSPALEDFCLVVCHVCNQVVTPQGILAHYEKRHASPVPSRSPLVPMKPKAPAVAPGPGDSLAFRVPKDYPHSRFSKAPLAVYPPKGARNKTCVSLPVVSLEKMPCLNRADSASHVRLTSSSSSSASSAASPSPLKPPSLTPPAPQRPGEKLANGRGSSGPSTPRSTASPSSLDGRPSPARSPLDRRPSSTPSPSPLDRKPSPSPSPSHRPGALPPSSSSSSSSPLDKKHQNGTKASSRSQKRLSGRVFDPNKHCGVQDPETKRPCTRSLTCKTHSLTHRRAVPGRRKHFDILLAEHKGRPKEGAKEKEREREGAQGGKEGSGHGVKPQETASPSKPHCPNGRPLSTLKLRLANAHIPRVPCSATSSPLPPVPAPAQAQAPHPELSPHGWAAAAAGDGGRLSSDEGDAETPEDVDRPAFHCSNHHPQPLGYCVFSSRLMGRGYYVFDRRWDRMRLALQNMVEKHLNAQMWRKVPLAAESLRSLSPSGASPVASQRTPSPSSAAPPLLCAPSNSLSYAAALPQPAAAAAGPFSIRDAVAPVPAAAKARNGAHKAGRPSKDSEDSVVGSKKRKNSSYSSSSSSSSFSSSLFPTVDNHKRNGSSYHPTLQGSGSAAAVARKKGPVRGGSGLWGGGGGGEDWLPRSDGSQSHNSQNSRELGTTSIPYSPGREPASALHHQPLAPPSGPLAYVGGAEGRKRRSPSSYRGKAGKLSRPGGLESLFGGGSDSGGILASGPESPRQTKLHH